MERAVVVADHVMDRCGKLGRQRRLAHHAREVRSGFERVLKDAAETPFHLLHVAIHSRGRIDLAVPGPLIRRNALAGAPIREPLAGANEIVNVAQQHEANFLRAARHRIPDQGRQEDFLEGVGIDVVRRGRVAKMEVAEDCKHDAGSISEPRKDVFSFFPSFISRLNLPEKRVDRQGADCYFRAHANFRQSSWVSRGSRR